MPVIRPAVRRLVPVDLRARVHFRLVGTPGVSALFTRFDPAMRMTRVTRGTRLVIDGYPRSGNTYARAAFLYANGLDFPLSTHRHSAQSVKEGLRRGIPVIVLVRDPRAALASGLQYEPGSTPRMAMNVYRSFYEGVLPRADEVVIATFAEVTSDFGQVVRRCNARFGTDFVPYERTEEAEAEVVRMIDEGAKLAFNPEVLDRVTGRPSSTRRSADEVLSELTPAEQAMLAELGRLYDAVIAEHDRQLEAEAGGRHGEVGT